VKLGFALKSLLPRNSEKKDLKGKKGHDISGGGWIGEGGEPYARNSSIRE